MNTRMNTRLPIDLAEPTRAGQNTAWKPILLRMPVGLLAHIDAAAAAGHRSRTAEVLMRLEASAVGESIDGHGVIVRRVASTNK